MVSIFSLVIVTLVLSCAAKDHSQQQFNITIEPYVLNPADILRSPGRQLRTMHFGGPRITACVVIRDESQDIVEWLEYHRWLGFLKVYLYDHDSNNPALTAVMPFIREGYVEYSYIHADHVFIRDKHHTGWMKTSQGMAYADCLHKAKKNRDDWIAYLDMDEFVVLGRTQPNLGHLLASYKEFGGLALNWRVFSGRPHRKRPVGGVLANYNWALPDDHRINRHVKVIVQPELVKNVPTPHIANFEDADKKFMVDELKRKVKGSYTLSPTHKKVWVNHYLTRSDEDFLDKITKGSGNAGRRNWIERNMLWDEGTVYRPLGIKLAQQCCPSVWVMSEDGTGPLVYKEGPTWKGLQESSIVPQEEREANQTEREKGAA